MRKYLFVCGCLFLLCTFRVLSQGGEVIDKKEQKRILAEGEYLYEEGNYVKALEYFKKLEKIDPNDLYYKLIIGICYSHKVDEKEKSIPYLESVKELNPDFNEVNLYLGRAYAVNRRFDDAIAILETYLQDEDISDESAAIATRLIENCHNGKELVSDSLDVAIRNMGTVLNSEAAEYVPLVTPDEAQLIFTYKGPKSLGTPDSKGEYFEDIYISYKSPDDWMYDDDIWLEPEGIESINTENDDACIAISIDGQTLFLYKYKKTDGGDIYVSQLDGKIWSEPLPLNEGVNTKYWEGSMAISSDEQELYFSSERPGGFGGRDLYSAEKMEDGSWGNIQNLGPNINTPYNDDAPFLQIDKQTLFFSSEGHNSMGGYDIFFVRREGDGWSAPQNLGYPINTVEHDRYFVMNASGQKGFYSSAGFNSLGDQDLFYVELDPEKLGIKSIAALIVGTVFVNDEPARVEININNATLNIPAPPTTFSSNSETGNYRVAIAPGYAYSITYTVEGFEPHVDSLDLSGLNEYIEVSNNVFIYSKEYMEANNIVPEERTGLQALADSAIMKVERQKEEAIAAITEPAKTPADPISPTSPATPVIPPAPTPADPDLAIVPKGSASGEGEEKEGGVAGVTGGETPQGSEEETPIAAVVPGGTTGGEEEGTGEPATTPGAGAAALAEKGDEPCSDEFVDLSAFVGRDLNKEEVYNDFLNVVGNYCADDLIFKVQIGAYRHPENFKYTHLKQFGTAKVVDYPDGITRFTFGEFVTLKDADDLRQRIIVAGQKDAWVVPFFDGERMFMEDLIKVNFYNRSVN